MALFTALPSAARASNANSGTLSVPRNAPLRVYVDVTAFTTNFTIFLEETINGKWFALGSSGTISATGQYTFATGPARGTGQVRVRYAAGSATFAVYVAMAGAGAGGAHQRVALASAARQADANSNPFILPPESGVQVYVDVTARPGDDTAVVRLQEQVLTKWYDLAVTATINAVATYAARADGPRTGGPLRCVWDHTVVTTADNITAEVRVAA